MASSSKTAALMEGRLRAARSGGATQVKIEPSTSRGRNTAGLGAEAAARAAEANFGSFAEIRRETRLITPLATAIQSGLRTVLGTVMPQNDLPAMHDVGVKYAARYIEIDSMYLYIKAGPSASTNEAVIYRRDLAAAYDVDSDLIVIRHHKPQRGESRRSAPMRTMRFRGATPEDHCEWVHRLTGEEIPDLEASYVMVYRSLEMPGVNYPPIDADGNIPDEQPHPSAATQPAAPSDGGEHGPYSGGGGGGGAMAAPPRPERPASSAAPAPSPAPTPRQPPAAVPAPSVPPPAPSAPPADSPPMYDDSLRPDETDLPPPYFG